MAVVLIGGGARSGKSRFAQRYAEERHSGGVFVATAEARDEEMRERIRRHQDDRSAFWRTVEAPLELPAALEREQRGDGVILVDCLTLWLSNVLLAERDVEEELRRLDDAVRRWGGPSLLLVTNEVGCGIVPENALARRFRDLAGQMNQLLAHAADEVYWTAFGLPLKVKP